MSTPAKPRHWDAAALFRRYAPFVASFLHKLGASRSELDDLVQEVFMVAHRRGGFVEDGRARPSTWLAEIARRVIMSARRKSSKRPVDLDDSAVRRLPTNRPSPVRAVETNESLARVWAALDELDEQKRAVFVLFELEGEPCAAIAEAFDIPIGTVYSRLHKARKEFFAAHERLRTARGEHAGDIR